MEAWGKAQNATNKVRLFADTNADLTKVIDYLKIIFG